MTVTTDPRVAEASRLAGQVLDEAEKAVVGKRDALMLVMAAVLAKSPLPVHKRPPYPNYHRSGGSPTTSAGQQ